MSYIAKNPEAYLGKVVGTGQCVAFVQAATDAPRTSLWKDGSKVDCGKLIPTGTALATFVNGKYPDRNSGNHAAIFIKAETKGIWVYDQWVGQPVHVRMIYFRHGKSSPSNDANAFSVVE